MFDRNMIGRDRRFEIAEARAVRIQPGVQLQPPLVRLGHGKLERVVGRRRRLPHPPRQVFRPRLDFRFIQSIATWADLQHDHIESQRGRAIQDGEQLLFLPRRIRPCWEGQSLLLTVAIHNPRNSRWMAAARPRTTGLGMPPEQRNQPSCTATRIDARMSSIPATSRKAQSINGPAHGWKAFSRTTIND